MPDSPDRLLEALVRYVFVPGVGAVLARSVFRHRSAWGLSAWSGRRAHRNVAGFDQARNEFRSDLERALNTEVLPRLSGEAARTQLRRILETGISEVGRADPGEVLETRRSASGYLRIRVAERELKARLLKLFQIAIHKEYVADFGIELAALSLYCDERVPFGPDRPPEATCSTNVRLRERQNAARVGGR
jgi:hypothetical protein